MSKKNEKEARKMNLAEALIVFGVVVALIGFTALNDTVPIAMGIFLALVISFAYGVSVLHFSFDDLFTGATDTVSSVFFGLMFCLSVGFVSAAWLASGTIPFMLYWGLELINPNMFLFIAFITCSIASFVTGQAWTMIPTLGLAYIGIASALQIPLPLAAGAIVSGCFLGDAASPLCEVPAIATTCAGSKNVIGTIKSMIPTKGVGIVIGAIAFFIIGMKFSGVATDFVAADQLKSAVVGGFNLSPLTLIPLIIVFVLVFLKVNPLASVIIGALVGVVEAVLLQHMRIFDVLAMMWKGFVCQTGDAQLDALLTRGGIMDFAGTIMMLLIAFSFAGVINKMGLLEAIVNNLLKLVTNKGTLVIITTITTLLGVMLTCSANVSSVLTGTIYKDAYKRMGMAPENLAREMAMNGSVFNAMLPWSASGALCFTTLGVVPFEYWIYMIPFWVALVLNIVWTFLGKFTPLIEEEKAEEKIIEMA